MRNHLIFLAYYYSTSDWAAVAARASVGVPQRRLGVTSFDWLIELHNAYQFKMLLHLLPFGCNLKGEFWDLQIWGLGECWDLHQSKAHPRLHSTNTNFCSYATVCQQYQCQVMTPNSTPISGVRMDPGGRKWYQSKCRPHIPIRLLHIYIGRLCHSIGGLTACRMSLQVASDAFAAVSTTGYVQN